MLTAGLAPAPAPRVRSVVQRDGRRPRPFENASRAHSGEIPSVRLNAMDPDRAFAILDLARSATEAEVDSAFKERVKTAHPDAAGGSNGAMKELNEARVVALALLERSLVVIASAITAPLSAQMARRAPRAGRPTRAWGDRHPRRPRQDGPKVGTPAYSRIGRRRFLIHQRRHELRYSTHEPYGP